MRTRFAPSPTGYLHLGHALSAWAVEALGAEMLLRIEDIDPVRCKPEYRQAIFEDLAWLGLRYDGDVLHQSQRMEVYAPYIEQLKARGLIYPCICTRRQVLAASPGMGPDGPIYGGTCKGHDVGGDVAWRLDMEAALEDVGDGLPYQDHFEPNPVSPFEPNPTSHFELVEKYSNRGHESYISRQARDDLRGARRDDLRGARRVKL